MDECENGVCEREKLNWVCMYLEKNDVCVCANIHIVHVGGPSNSPLPVFLLVGRLSWFYAAYKSRRGSSVLDG